MKIKELMHDGVETLAPETSIQIVAKTMKEKDIGAIAIQAGGGDGLVGIVTDRDIVLAMGDGRDICKMTAGDIMSRQVMTCRDTDQVRDVLHAMESKRVRRLPVVNHNKKVVGMVSLGDISHKAPRDLTAEVLKAVSAHHS